jgi:hypothetical protein
MAAKICVARTWWSAADNTLQLGRQHPQQPEVGVVVLEVVLERHRLRHHGLQVGIARSDGLVLAKATAVRHQVAEADRIDLVAARPLGRQPGADLAVRGEPLLGQQAQGDDGGERLADAGHVHLAGGRLQRGRRIGAGTCHTVGTTARKLPALRQRVGIADAVVVEGTAQV